MFCCGCFCLFGVDVNVVGVRAYFLVCEKTYSRGLHKNTNRQNPGLTSVDRKTSLLSHVQYPVLSKSSTKDLSLSVPERRLNLVLGRSLSLRVNTESGYIVAFQHRF